MSHHIPSWSDFVFIHFYNFTIFYVDFFSYQISGMVRGLRTKWKCSAVPFIWKEVVDGVNHYYCVLIIKHNTWLIPCAVTIIVVLITVLILVLHDQNLVDQTFIFIPFIYLFFGIVFEFSIYSFLQFFYVDFFSYQNRES